MKKQIAQAFLAISGTAALSLTTSSVVDAQDGTVLSLQKISNTTGGFQGSLQDGDIFGGSVCNLGDVDGDGIQDLAVGAWLDDDGGVDCGSVWILFLHADGTVKHEQKISSLAGDFSGSLSPDDRFGWNVGSLGDLDGDGVPDLAVCASRDDDGGVDWGALWILFLRPDGTVKSEQKLSALAGGLQGVVTEEGACGRCVANLGDLDGDGVIDLAVGGAGVNDGGTKRGAVWILLLNSNGTVKAHHKISDTEGNFQGQLHDGDRFGCGVANLGDLDGDGLRDIAVGAWYDDDGGSDRGAVWILFLNADYTVRTHQKISDTQGNFAGILDDYDYFGRGMATPGDLDGDGIFDLVVGAHLDDNGGTNRGATWVLFLDTDGTVKIHQKISATEGNFTSSGGALSGNDYFGISIAALGDLNGDHQGDLVVGALCDDDGGPDRGAVWVLFLQGAIQAESASRNPCANPESQAALNRPRVGQTYRIEVDLYGTTGHAAAMLFGYAGALTYTLPGGPCVLTDWLDPAGELTGCPVGGAPVAGFDLPIPNFPLLVGTSATTQALQFGGGVAPVALSNALDAFIGY